MVTGLTFTAKGTPVAGTEYVNYTVTTSGVLQNVGTYVSSLLATGGMFDAESTSATAQNKNIDARVTDMNNRLAQRQRTLQRQFTQMEISLQKLQSQGASLLQKLGSTPQ
jgi:flagellar capping protein FliD